MIERKVTAATGGSAVGVALAGLILWMLDTYVFTDRPIPDAVSFAVVTLLPVGLTFAGGYLARHTPRPDPAAAGERLTFPAPTTTRTNGGTGTNVTKVPKLGGYEGGGLPPPPLSEFRNDSGTPERVQRPPNTT